MQQYEHGSLALIRNYFSLLLGESNKMKRKLMKKNWNMARCGWGMAKCCHFPLKHQIYLLIYKEIYS